MLIYYKKNYYFITKKIVLISLIEHRSIKLYNMIPIKLRCFKGIKKTRHTLTSALLRRRNSI
jgi:hypothetical protein